MKENKIKFVRCSKCNKKTHPLEIFSEGECLKCHEKKFNEELKKNGGILPKPGFINTINKEILKK